MAENDDNATSFAAGTLSLDYLNSLSRSYAGADYAVTSQMRWALNSAPGLLGAAGGPNRGTGVQVNTAASLPGDAVEHRGTATRRTSKKPVEGQDRPIELSDREKTCLGWTALGKSSWETGQILLISENTVIFHIKNAMRK